MLTDGEHCIDQALTRGEDNFIARRRRGHTQREAAEARGVSLRRYAETEKDPEKAGPRLLSPGEWCLIMRRRAGKTQDEVARDLEVCRYHVHRMETGRAPPDELLWYWEA